MKSGIYCITVTRPSKPDLYYIGQATNQGRRKTDHFKDLRGHRHCNRRLQALFDKYGDAAFDFRTLIFCETSVLTFYEQIILDFYVASFGRRTLNICRECVSASRGAIRTPETKAKLSAAKRGKPGRIWTPESRQKVSATKKGIPPSKATIEAGIKANTGRYPSAETRLKMSLSRRGRQDSAETRVNKSIAAMAREARKRLSAGSPLPE